MPPRKPTRRLETRNSKLEPRATSDELRDWPADRIRQTFLGFFEEQGHKVVPSSPLVPFGDPTLLFTSAGMVQFKPYFEGRAQPPAPRLASVQKCFRTSDIDSVGDGHHLTFFEMLGNFSVGDPSTGSGQGYFKAEAIPWAWELVTKVIGLPADRLWTAVFLDDDEAFDLWRKVGVPKDRIMRYGEEENYWFSGDIGPCGPCSEIYYDFGPTTGCPQCEKGECHPQIDCRDEHGVARFLELWNLVFMTFYQHEDGTRTPLPQKNIDTGAGLERWAAVLQNGGERASVFDTDLFRPIIDKVAELSGRAYGQDGQTDRAIRIVAEHARAAAFLIADGVMPSNEGRGYVLRRIMRRAMLYGLRLAQMALSIPIDIGAGATSVEELGRRIGVYDAISSRRVAAIREGKRFLTALGSVVINEYKRAYPDLHAHRAAVETGFKGEEERSAAALFKGEALFRQIGSLRARARHLLHAKDPDYNFQVFLEHAGLSEEVKELAIPVVIPSFKSRDESSLARVSGREVFTLHDTYGFHKEFTAEFANQYGLTIDEDGFEREMEAQRERARAAAKFGPGREEREKAYEALSHLESRFVGYDTLTHQSTVAAIVAGGEAVDSASEGDEVEVVLHETPFYAEGGGQVGDQGVIEGPEGRVEVDDTQTIFQRLIVHRGRVVQGRIAVNDAVIARVDAQKRADTMRNHTATHLLHAALRQVLGSHVRQSGSLVAPDRLRFDFTHMEALKPEALLTVQRLVNDKIRADIPVHPVEKGYEEAIAGGALAFFGEKYAERVRVVEVCEPEPANGQARKAERCFSAELCGGTHCRSTGQVGTFLIVGEESIGAGVRRIEALTGRAAEAYMERLSSLVARISELVGEGRATSYERLATLPERVVALQEELRAQSKRLQALERESARRDAQGLLETAERVDGVSVVTGRVSATNMESLREAGDWLRDRLGSAVVVLGAVINGRPSFVAMITRDLTLPKKGGLHAGELVKRVAAVAGGAGGGRPDMAQAGGKDPARLDEALKFARRLAREALTALPP